MTALELKATTRFAGYAAIFDRADSSGDIIRRGAFRRAVAAGPKAVPLLWQHDGNHPIGVIEQIAEDERGLRIIGRLNDQTATARVVGYRHCDNDHEPRRGFPTDLPVVGFWMNVSINAVSRGFPTDLPVVGWLLLMLPRRESRGFPTDLPVVGWRGSSHYV